MQPPGSHPSQNLSSKTIDDPRSRIPPFPLSQPVDTEPPSDNGLDHGDSSQPIKGVERRSKVAMRVDNELGGTRLELPAAWPRPDRAKEVGRPREPMDSYEDWEH